jgi:hypothetical protein
MARYLEHYRPGVAHGAVLNVSQGIPQVLGDGARLLARRHLDRLLLVDDSAHGGHHGRSAGAEGLQQLQKTATNVQYISACAKMGDKKVRKLLAT